MRAHVVAESRWPDSRVDWSPEFMGRFNLLRFIIGHVVFFFFFKYSWFKNNFKNLAYFWGVRWKFQYLWTAGLMYSATKWTRREKI